MASGLGWHHGPVSDLVLVVRYRKAVTYGFHALLGALETHDTPTSYEVRFAESADATIAEIKDALSTARRVLVLWSFYSPDAAALADELASIKAAAPGAVHLAGGVHATAEPVQTLDAGWDVAAIGEGELSRGVGRCGVAGPETMRRLDAKSFNRLTGDTRDDVKVLVDMQHGVSGTLGRGGDHEVRDAGRAMLSDVGEVCLHFNRPLLHCGRQVFDRHQRQRRLARCAAEFSGCSGRVSDLEQGHRRDVNETSSDSLSPHLGVGTVTESHKS